MLDGLFGKKERVVITSGRGRPRGSRDQAPRKPRAAIEILQDRALRRLEKTDPELIEKIALKRLGIGGDDSNGFAQMIAFAKQYDEAREAFGGNGGDRSSKNEWMDIAKAFFASGMQFLAAQRTQAIEPAPAQIPAPIQPAPTPSPIPPQAPPTTEPVHVKPIYQMAPASIVLMGVLGTRYPHDEKGAAEWLLAQRDNADVAALVPAFLNTSDDQIVSLLFDTSRKHPGIADFVDWVRADPERAAWFVRVAQALRTELGVSVSDTNVAL